MMLFTYGMSLVVLDSNIYLCLTSIKINTCMYVIIQYRRIGYRGVAVQAQWAFTLVATRRHNSVHLLSNTHWSPFAFLDNRLLGLFLLSYLTLYDHYFVWSIFFNELSLLWLSWINTTFGMRLCINSTICFISTQ